MDDDRRMDCTDPPAMRATKSPVSTVTTTLADADMPLTELLTITMAVYDRMACKLNAGSINLEGSRLKPGVTPTEGRVAELTLTNRHEYSRFRDDLLPSQAAVKAEEDNCNALDRVVDRVAAPAMVTDGRADSTAEKETEPLLQAPRKLVNVTSTT